MKFKNINLKSGFSLTEMLVVLAVLAILIALIVSSIMQQHFKGNDAKRKTDLNRIKIAVEEYEKDHNCYPDAIAMSACGLSEDIPVHPYLSNVPCDPVTGAFYAYEDDGSACPKWFRIYSILEYKKDSQIVLNIGPGDLYNFYLSSDNAPNEVAGVTPTSSPTPTGTYTATSQYGCKAGVCVPITLDAYGNPECQPNYDNANCYNQCGTPANPASECVSN